MFCNFGSCSVPAGLQREADLVGMELAARGGFDPQAGITLWEKMGRASKGAPPEFLPVGDVLTAGADETALDVWVDISGGDVKQLYRIRIAESEAQ